MARQTARGTVETRTIRLGARELSYELRRSARRRKTISLNCRDRELRVAAPLKTPLAEVETLLLQRAEWILRQLERPAIPALREQLLNDGQLPLLGSTLRVRVSLGREPRAECSGGTLALSARNAEQLAVVAENWFREARGRAARAAGQRVGPADRRAADAAAAAQSEAALGQRLARRLTALLLAPRLRAA